VNILGIDPGTKSIGYALVSPWDAREFRPTRPILIGATRHTSTNVERRLVAAQKAIEEILKQCEAHGPFSIVYEEPPAQWRSKTGGRGRQLNQRASFMLGQSCGMIRAVNQSRGNPIPKAVPVSSWRKVARQLGVVHRSAKTDTVEWIRSKFELEVKHDAGEAYALALAYISCPTIARG
jgi:Holliday junction resolvasome RuvABC endonuclease subunit